MPPDRKMYTFWIDAELAKGLKAIKEHEGISESEQIRRAIRSWLDSKGATKKTASRRASTRRKA